jgi:hypothetical protein
MTLAGSRGGGRENKEEERKTKTTQMYKHRNAITSYTTFLFSSLQPPLAVRQGQ